MIKDELIKVLSVLQEIDVENLTVGNRLTLFTARIGIAKMIDDLENPSTPPTCKENLHVDLDKDNIESENMDGKKEFIKEFIKMKDTVFIIAIAEAFEGINLEGVEFDPAENPLIMENKI